MIKKIQNLIILFGLLVLFAGVLAFVAVQEVFAFSLAVETGSEAPPGMMPTTPPSEKAVSPAPGENDTNSQDQTSVLPGGAENLEKRIQDIEARGKNLEAWNSIITALFIISLLFNVYFGLKVRYILRKIGTTQ